MITTLLQTLLAAQCATTANPDDWPEDYADHALQQGLDSYDFVVIGAGSAGSVIASRLSENPKWKVLVLEAGGDPPQESEVPKLFFTIQHTNYTWNYQTAPNGNSCLGMKGKSCYWPRGKMIGGSGAINGMLYVRGNRGDFDHWAQKGNNGWGWNAVLPYFEKSITPVGTDAEPKGYTVVNEYEKINMDMQDMIYAGAKELGYAHLEESTMESVKGYSNLQGTVASGRRMSTGKTYLGKVRERPNLHVIKNALVTKINFDKSGTRATSVSFTVRGKKTMSVCMKKEVVLSAGTIESAKLLMLSGVGRQTDLSKLRIPVIKNLPIGQNLQDHLFTLVVFKILANADDTFSDSETLFDATKYFVSSTGPMAGVGTLPVTGFVNTVDSNDPYPNTEFHHIYIKRGDYESLHVVLEAFTISPEYAVQVSKHLESFHLLLVLNTLSHPKSTGNVILTNTNCDAEPKINPNYLAEKADVDVLLLGIRYLERLASTLAFRANFTEIVEINVDECSKFIYKTDDYWRCYIKYFSTTLYHLTGTVKMGPETDKTSCVSPRLMVHGIHNLRVADASIMPDVPSANTNAPTIMIAERAADFIKVDWDTVVSGTPRVENTCPQKDGSSKFIDCLFNGIFAKGCNPFW